MNLIRAVDVSSHQEPSLQTLNEWIADGCQLLLIHAYHRYEYPGLDASTRDWIRVAQQAGCWRVGYCWLFRSADVRQSIRDSLAVFRGEGEIPTLLALDCESYDGPGGLDPGPSADQLREAFDECAAQRVAPIIYTAEWWIHGYLDDPSVLAGRPAWLAAYNDIPDLASVHPVAGLEIIGHQYKGSPVDWSVFDLDRLTELSEEMRRPDPNVDPCKALKEAIRAELARPRLNRKRLAALVGG